MAENDQKYIVFGGPRFTDEEISEVVKVFRSGWVGTGPRTAQFEKEFAKYIGTSQAMALSSCTAALQIALEAYGIGEGDEVITTSMTFAATVNAIIATGARPVLVDVEAGSFSLDLNQVESAITPKTRAIIPVHFAGAPVNLRSLMTLRKKHGVKIIHDCAHAIETYWEGKNIGTFADAACYSFYPTKNITTIEGGMICSDDELFMSRARPLGYHGLTKDAWSRFTNKGYSHYDIQMPGHKFNLTDVQSALGLCQLAKIDAHYEKRAALWKVYQEAFAPLGFEKPLAVPDHVRHAFHCTPFWSMRKIPV
jgi:dTDP-4-amino-4,6-dideoxygalactose transaminase